MSRTLEQFIRFTSDAVGLERTFRLFQALTQILSSYTLAFDLLFRAVLALSAGGEKPTPSPEALGAALVGIGQRLALVRRFLRLFRFLESFSAAHALYIQGSSGGPSQKAGEKQQQRGAKTTTTTTPRPGLEAEDWLDVLGRTFNGMYLLLEASVIVDVAGVPGLALWGAAATPRVSLEAQRFWLLALVCGVLAGLLRIVKTFAHAAVSEPVRGEQDRDQDQGGGEKNGREAVGKWDLKTEQARLREAVGHGAAARGRGVVEARVRRLARGIVANALDIALPGTAVGWLELSPGTVGVAMFATSVLTGLDVWEKCGSEVRRQA